jgi:hypothetical protein
MGLGLGNINANRSEAKKSHLLYAMHFDGSADFEQAVDSNHTTFGNGTNDLDFSIIVWFKVDSITSTNNPVFYKLNEYLITVINKTIKIVLYDNNTSNYRQWVTGNVVLGPDKWNCAIFVANGDGSGGIADGEMTLYLNGSALTAGSGLTASDNGTYAAMHNKGNHRTGSDGSNLLDGLVGQIAILNQAIGPAGAARIYNNGVPTNLVARHGISSAIKAYWKYGNTAGDTIAAVQDLGAADVDMEQGTASKQPVLITGANVRTGVN